MRLIIRLLTPSQTLEHLAQKTLNKTLSTSLQQGKQLNPFQPQSQSSQFQLSYLITHNTKVIRANYLPLQFTTQQLIQYVAKILQIKQEYLILKICNKYYQYQKYKDIDIKGKGKENYNQNNKNNNNNNNNNKNNNNDQKQKQLQQKNYGGIRFTEQTIKYVRLLKGFKLHLFNIDIEDKIKYKNLINNTSTSSKQSQQSLTIIQSQNFKTLQIQAQILQAYYSSPEYKQIVHEIRMQNVRKTKIFKQKFNLQQNQIIQQQQNEQEDQDNQQNSDNQQINEQNNPQSAFSKKPKKIQNLNFQSYQQQLTQYTTSNQKTYDTTISKHHGQLLRIRKPPLKDHLHYYLIDPYQGVFKQFQSKQKYPFSPLQVISLNFITQPVKDIQKIQKKDISWYMKKQFSYFSVEFTIKNKKQRFKFAAKFQQTVDKWIKGFKQCVEKYTQIKTNQKILMNLVQNQKVILDRIQLSPNMKKKTSDQYKNAFNKILTKTNNTESMHEENLMNINRNSNNMNNNNEIPLPQNAQLCGFVGSESNKIQQNNQNNNLPPSLSQILSSKTSNTQTKTSSTSNSFNQQQSQPKQSQKKATASLKLSHFKFLTLLGQGSFGQVYLAQHTPSSSLFALKSFKKKKLIMNKQIKFAISQISILKQIHHPYIITLHFTFQTPNYIYLGIDYCKGKDLSHHLIQQINFTQQDSKIYAAELVLALEYLHSKDIIYRDLKPENILLDEQGHLKIIDFGLSKQTQDNFAKSFCGSPAYISPEMLKKNGVGKQCDFFSLGAVIYEMIVGQPPFYSEDIKQLYDNIANAKLKFPKVVSEKARSLLEGLLRKNPKTRLGSNGFKQIKTHDFFKGLNWQQIAKKQHKSPKRVTLQNIQNQEMNQQNQQTELVKILHEDFDYTEATMRINRFKNFSFVREGMFQGSK